MEKKSAKTPKPADIKKQLEAIAGHEIHASREQLIRLFFPAATFTVGDGEVTVKGIFIPFKNCYETTLLDASGFSTTGANGQRTFLLSQFVCTDGFNSYSEPVNIVATPHSETPFFLTHTHSLVNPVNGVAGDLQITVFAWDTNGNPAPNVDCDWRCRVTVSDVVIIE